MGATMKSLGIDLLPFSERLALVEEIWDSIEDAAAAAMVSDAELAELDRRLADHLAHPDAVVPWEDVKSSAVARFKA